MKPGRISDHVTILALAVGISALVGALAGVSASVLVGGFALSDLVNRWASGEPWVDVSTTRAVSELEEENATISAAKNVSPSVVSVIAHASFGDSEQLIEVGGGTGFLVSEDGLILTNRHVVHFPNASYTVVTNDGAELPARLIATDPFLDVAILDVEGNGYPVATLGNSDRLKVGQTVIAIGNALSSFRNTVTRGVVSGLDRRVIAGDEFGGDELLERAIQTDASINPGNSGGPLLILSGEVIGMNTALSADGQGVGFAIPVNDLKRAVADVQQYGRIVHAWLGIRYIPLSAEFSAGKDLPVKDGAWVAPLVDGRAAVLPGSPAEKFGVKAGDIIVSIDGGAITEEHGLSRMISRYRPGDRITLRIVRGEERFDLPVTLAEYDPDLVNANP